jgi:hypothetical protein
MGWPVCTLPSPSLLLDLLFVWILSSVTTGTRRDLRLQSRFLQ